MSFTKFLDPKNDFAFKRIFGTDKNKDILIPFLNEMLNFKGEGAIKDVQFLNPNQDPDIAIKKQSLVDVLCEDHLGRQYIVEMQVAKTKGFEKRAQYYAAKTYSNQLDRSEQYDNLKEVIFLAITDFIMFEDKTEYKSNHVILDKETHEHDLKDLAFTFLELPKFTKKLDELETLTDRWVYFLKNAGRNPDEDIERVIGGQKEIAQAYQALNRYSLSTQEMRIYEQEEKRERDNQAVWEAGMDDATAKGLAIGEAIGEAKGKAIGEAIGEAKGKKETAINLIKAKVDCAIIATATGLTIDEIEDLKRSISD